MRWMRTMTKDARKQEMLRAVPVEELSQEELNLIEWLAGWDYSVTERFVSILNKVRGEENSENHICMEEKR